MSTILSYISVSSTPIHVFFLSIYFSCCHFAVRIYFMINASSGFISFPCQLHCLDSHISTLSVTWCVLNSEAVKSVSELTRNN
jgi:hypothetical protein